MKKPYYKTCPHCGSNLDPGEKCDCQKPGAGFQVSETLTVTIDLAAEEGVAVAFVTRHYATSSRLINAFFGKVAEEVYQLLTNGQCEEQVSLILGVDLTYDHTESVITVAKQTPNSKYQTEIINTLIQEEAARVYSRLINIH